MKKRWGALVALALAALLGYGIAGPYLAINGIRDAIEDQNAAALSRHVDFPALRASLKAQLGDRLVRSVGLDAQSGVLGALGMRLAGGLIDGAVETMVTPTGLAALMEGRKVWSLVGSGLARPRWADAPDARQAHSDAPDASAVLEADAPPPAKPLDGARYRYESLSRFTATVPYEGEGEVVFVLTRKGLWWKLSDIRLPPARAGR